MIHLFSEADAVQSTGILNYPADGSPLQSILTYPVNETIWVQDWQGEKSLRFESAEEGQLRGSLFMLHEPIQPAFKINLKSWLDADAPEAWSGVCFWMFKTNKHAVGARWIAKKSKNILIAQIFKYDFPHVNSLVQRVFPFDQSRWANIELAVEDNRASLKVDDNESFVSLLQPDWRIGDFWGFFQGQGTGYFTGIHVQTAEEDRRVDDLFDNWNQEIFNTSRKVVLDALQTPDDFVGNDIPIRRIMIADDWRSATPVLSPSELTYRTRVPENAVFHASYGILPAFSLSNATVEFEIIFRSSGQDHQAFSRRITPAGEPLNAFQYHDIHIPLDDYAGQEIDVVLRVNRIAGDDPFIGCWAEPTIGTRSPKKKRPNVLLILLDTLRADRVGVYGCDRGLTPNIDRLSEKGAAFLQTVAQAPWTTPSHASFFTGLYPSETDCDHTGTEGNILQEPYITWAEYLQREGYNTAAFTSGGAIRGYTNLTQGFDAYQDIVYDSAYGLETLYERFQRWQDAHAGEPWFVFLHTYAVHFPYEHEQYIGYRKIFRNWEDNRRYLHDVYDGGVRYADEWVGAVVRCLQERNLMDSTLIIVTSDHGEALGDRWMPRPANHGHTLYDELLLVPLIFHLPGHIPAGRKIEKQVRLIDMLPTVLDLLGYKQPAFTHGLSLMPLMRGEKEKAERYAFSEGMTYGVAQNSIRTQNYKYIFVPDPETVLDTPPTGISVPAPPSNQLYDLANDPGEIENIAVNHPEKIQAMEVLINLHKKLVRPPSFFIEEAQFAAPAILPPQVVEELNKLGYAEPTNN
ncbi:MAG: sulfatase [Candidatus Omnitrophica bacterium]|nr:sulfatase [Candidatus Omnitrophota bacterium]